MYLTKLASFQLVIWNMLEKYNHDPDEVFRKVQLDPTLMHQPGARYSLQKVNDLWAEVNRRIKDPCCGLTAATCWHPSCFGTLGYAMLASKSLRIGLERLIRFHQVISDVEFGKIHIEKDLGALVFTLLYRDEEPFPQSHEDATLALMMSVLRMNFQQDFTPVFIHFTHSSPRCAGKYYELFHSPITFDSPSCRLALPLNIVDRILPSGNEELVAFNEQMMTQYLASLNGEDLITRVKKIIVEHLPSGDATVENVASELYLSTRKLQRSLQQEHMTFIALLRETRMEIAKQYVQNKNMNLTEIAFLLGFSEQSSFSRFFKRWTGKTPIQYRMTA